MTVHQHHDSYRATPLVLISALAIIATMLVGCIDYSDSPSPDGVLDLTDGPSGPHGWPEDLIFSDEPAHTPITQIEGKPTNNRPPVLTAHAHSSSPALGVPFGQFVLI